MKEDICEECGSRLFDKCDNCNMAFPSLPNEADGWMLVSIAFNDVEGVGFKDFILCSKCLREKLSESAVKEIRKTIEDK